MIAFKGFNGKMECTMGKGIYQYRVGETYREGKAQCAATGFHCVEEPLDVLSWYKGENDRYCIVKAEGDIHEDGCDRISCTEITIVREIDIMELAILECRFLQQHPNRKCSKHVKHESGMAECGIAIVRGKHPMARGKKGDCLFLLTEAPESSEIVDITAMEIDGKDYKPNIYYGADGKENSHDKK